MTYCEGRKNLVPLPEVPPRFEFHAELVTPFFMDLVGLITAIRVKFMIVYALYYFLNLNSFFKSLTRKHMITPRISTDKIKVYRILL